jgi:hypothetical protein
MAKGDPQRRYKEKNIVRLCIDFNRVTEQPLIDRLEEQENKSGYVKRLISDDIKHDGGSCK